MALIRLGGGVAAASGSVGGNVYSRNRGGAYMRNRSVPINPGSVFQQNVRFAIASLASRWVEVLTDAQRAGWENYALQVPIPNALGDPINVGGVGMFIRGSASRVAFPNGSLAVIDDAPTIFDLGTFTQPGITSFSVATQQLTLTFDNTDAWASENASAMMVYVSRAMNTSINYFKGPYRFAFSIVGDSVTPPTSPEIQAVPFPFALGQKLFVRVNVTREDGRLASSFRDSSISVA